MSSNLSDFRGPSSGGDKTYAVLGELTQYQHFLIWRVKSISSRTRIHIGIQSDKLILDGGGDPSSGFELNRTE